MALRTLAAGLLAAFLAAIFPSLSAQAQQRPERSEEVVSGLHPALPSDAPSVQSAESLPTVQMPPVDREALPENDGSRDGRTGPYPYGTVLETRLTPDRHGTWEHLPSGDWLWRLRLQSDEAVSLSVGFTRFQLPEGAAVYVHGPDNADVRGPYTAADATNGQHWTPLVRGDELIIEMEVPDEQRAAVQVEVGRVVHGSRSIFPTARNDLSKSGTCNLDVACEEADPWSKEVRSVGLYTYEKNGRSYFCSGSLLNNTAEDRTPFFLTAEHCVTSPEVASTMVFYWNYQNSTCRLRGTSENGTETDDSRLDQTSSGAILRARYGSTHQDGAIAGKPDLALVEIDDEIPERYNLYFNGWSRTGEATAEGVTIHHPSAHGKRISFDDDSTTVTAYGESGGGNTHLRIGDWDLGTTEAGSSGGPLFNRQHQVVAVLSGGFAGCESAGSIEDNDLPDWYGRIAPGFEDGDYESRTLADWLDPLDTGADSLRGMSQSENVDRTAPAPVQDLRISRVNTSEREVTLRWTATGDDNRDGAATRYNLRFATAPIQTKKDFQQAQKVSDVPPPAEAGQPEQLVVDDTDGLEQDHTYYFALVAVDDAGNRSPQARPARKAVLVKEIEIGKGGVTTGAGQAVSETRFVLNETQEVRIVLYDLLGRRVRVVFEERVEEGFEQIVRLQTSSLSSGPYFLHFTGKSFATTRKITVVN